jgi:hypothetical protein
MFSFLKKSPPVTDPVLGELTRSRSFWRGFIDLKGLRVPLVVAGPGGGPEAEAIAVARALPNVFSASQIPLQQALFDHYSPYVEAGPPWPSPEPPPIIPAASDVWGHIRIESVSVTRWSAGFDGAYVAELAISAAWDEEHTLGARFADNQFVELNGSTIPIG